MMSSEELNSDSLQNYQPLRNQRINLYQAKIGEGLPRLTNVPNRKLLELNPRYYKNQELDYVYMPMWNLGYIINGIEHKKIVDCLGLSARNVQNFSNMVGDLTYDEFLTLALQKTDQIFQYLILSAKTISIRFKMLAREVERKKIQTEWAEAMIKKVDNFPSELDEAFNFSATETLKAKLILVDHFLNDIWALYSSNAKYLRKMLNKNRRLAENSGNSKEIRYWNELHYRHKDSGAYIPYLDDLIILLLELLGDPIVPTFVSRKSREILSEPILERTLSNARNISVSLKEYLCSSFGTFSEGFIQEIRRYGTYLVYDQLERNKLDDSTLQTRTIEKLKYPEAFIGKIISRFTASKREDLGKLPVYSKTTKYFIDNSAKDQNSSLYLSMMKNKIVITKPGGRTPIPNRWVRNPNSATFKDYVQKMIECGVEVRVTNVEEDQPFLIDNTIKFIHQQDHPMSDTGFSLEISQNAENLVYAPYGHTKFENGYELTVFDFPHIHVITDRDSYDWYRYHQDKLHHSFKNVILCETEDGNHQDLTHFFEIIRFIFSDQSVPIFRVLLSNPSFSKEYISLFNVLSKISENCGAYLESLQLNIYEYLGFVSQTELINFLKKFGFRFIEASGKLQYDGFNPDFLTFYINQAVSNVEITYFNYFLNKKIPKR